MGNHKSVWTIAIAVIAAGGVLPAVARSINVDLGFPGAEPPAIYRAAGLPGVWQKFPATQWGLYYDLVGLDGTPPPRASGRSAARSRAGRPRWPRWAERR